MLLISLVNAKTYNVLDLSRVCSFLKNQYVPKARLLRASFSPNYGDYGKAYVSDNLLGYEALTVCGLKELAEEIFKTLSTQYRSYLRSGRWEVLSGAEISNTPKVRFDRVLGREDNITIIAGVEGSKPLSDWREYTDWLFLEAINSLIKRNKSSANELFQEGMAFFDGYGFNDKAYNKTHTYDTYKLGLAVLTYRALGEPTKYKEEMNKILYVLSESEDPGNGGIFTGYKVIRGKLVFGGNVSDVNVETSSIIILALYSNYPKITSTINCNRPELPYLLIIILVITCFALSVLILFRFRKQ